MRVSDVWENQECWHPLCGRTALLRSQVGADDAIRLCWTLAASRVKYSEMLSTPSGLTTSMLTSGKVGAARTEAPSTERRRVEERIFEERSNWGFGVW